MKPLYRPLLTAFVVCISLLSLSLADKPCNDFVDTVLNQLKSNREFFQEPFEIPEEAKSFGIYDIESGYVYGLNTLHRVDDVVVFAKDKKHLKIYLGAGELNLQCSGRKKFFHIGKPIDVDAKVPFVTMELDIVTKSDGSNPEIKDFKIDDVKGVTVKFTGLGPLRNLLYNAFVRLVGRFFKRMVRDGIEDRLRQFLADKVKEFSVPEECLNDAWD